MTESPIDREHRIDTIAEQLREVAEQLPDKEERHEAEVKALVTGVPKEEPYPEQLKAFTGITHVMRVMMARQLEPKFREYLRDASPQLDLEPSDAMASRTALGTKKKAFAEKTTDELFALGLAVDWDGRPCHIIGNRAKKAPRGEYRLLPCGETEALVSPANWTEKYTSRISLIDAAEPGKWNWLSPVRR